MVFTLGPIRPIDNLYDNDNMNIAPRFGFSYSPDGQGKNVICGGVSTMYTSLEILVGLGVELAYMPDASIKASCTIKSSSAVTAIGLSPRMAAASSWKSPTYRS